MGKKKQSSDTLLFRRSNREGESLKFRIGLVKLRAISCLRNALELSYENQGKLEWFTPLLTITDIKAGLARQKPACKAKEIRWTRGIQFPHLHIPFVVLTTKGHFSFRMNRAEINTSWAASDTSNLAQSIYSQGKQDT